MGLHQLKLAADAVICLPNQRLFGLVADRTSLIEGFSIANDLLSRGVHGFWRVLTQPGLINVDFADICTVTRARHAECSLATAEAQGEHRVKELIEKLLKHPLMEQGRALNDASGVLVSIVGGPDLSLSEVSTLMGQINRHCENAHIILGAAIDPARTGHLAITLLSSSRAGKEKNTASEPEAAPTVAGEGSRFVDPTATENRASIPFAAPPTVTTENAREVLQGLTPRSRRKAMKMVQGQLPLELLSKNRFEKSPPTIRFGEDLDVPTYLRRNLVLN